MDLKKFMFFGTTSADIHQILLVADPRITKVIVLDHKNYSKLAPYEIEIQVYMRWSTESLAQREEAYRQLVDKLNTAVDVSIRKRLYLVEDFGE